MMNFQRTSRPIISITLFLVTGNAVVGQAPQHDGVPPLPLETTDGVLHIDDITINDNFEEGHSNANASGSQLSSAAATPDIVAVDAIVYELTDSIRLKIAERLQKEEFFSATLVPQTNWHDLELFLREASVSGDLRILSRPKTQAVAGTSAKFNIGQKVPVKVAIDNKTTAIEFSPIGISLSTTVKILEPAVYWAEWNWSYTEAEAGDSLNPTFIGATSRGQLKVKGDESLVLLTRHGDSKRPWKMAVLEFGKPPEKAKHIATGHDPDLITEARRSPSKLEDVQQLQLTNGQTWCFRTDQKIKLITGFDDHLIQTEMVHGNPSQFRIFAIASGGHGNTREERSRYMAQY